MGVFDEELRAAWGKLPKEKQDDLWKRYYDNRKNYLTKSAKPDETAEQISKQATDDANGLAKGQYIPHVIEPSAGVDRLILALIANAYSEVTETDDKGKMRNARDDEISSARRADQSRRISAAQKQTGTGEQSARSSRTCCARG